jgi:hypothetical protein
MGYFLCHEIEPFEVENQSLGTSSQNITLLGGYFCPALVTVTKVLVLICQFFLVEKLIQAALDIFQAQNVLNWSLNCTKIFRNSYDAKNIECFFYPTSFLTPTANNLRNELTTKYFLEQPFRQNNVIESGENVKLVFDSIQNS